MSDAIEIKHFFGEGRKWLSVFSDKDMARGKGIQGGVAWMHSNKDEDT